MMDDGWGPVLPTSQVGTNAKSKRKKTAQQQTVTISDTNIYTTPQPMTKPSDIVVVGTNPLATNTKTLVERVFTQNATKLSQGNYDIEALKAKIEDQAKNMVIASKKDVITLGASASKRVSDYSDQLLKQVRANDLDTVGGQLNEIIVLASDINVKGIVNYKPSKIPFFGALMNRFSPTKQKLLGKYESLSTQIDKIVKEVSITSTNLNSRTQTLDTVYDINTQEYYILEESILLGSVKLMELQETQQYLVEQGFTDPLQAQKISDVNATIEALEKRIADLHAMQMVTIQTAPMIRMIQQNNLSLVDKFNNLQVMTIPTWKKQFVLAIALIEQQKAVDLVHKIDDTTNAMLLNNAELLKQNTVGTAKALQRNIVDLATLEKVQSTLVETFKELDLIQQSAKKNRENFVTQIENLRTQTIGYQVN